MKEWTTENSHFAYLSKVQGMRKRFPEMKENTLKLSLKGGHKLGNRMLA